MLISSPSHNFVICSPEVMSTRSPSTSDILDMIAEAKRDCLRNVEARRKKEGTNPDPQPFVRCACRVEREPR